jgi:pimeloyl-ACP methyl ester carboxylesterase
LALGEPPVPEYPDRYWPESGSDDDLCVSTSAGAVHVRRAGQGPPVVLLHSNGHSWHEFADVIGPLAKRFSVYAWDMPGQGDSDAVHPRTSIQGYADVLAEVLDELGLEQTAVVGCSVGAFIGAELATRRPQRVSAVALVEFAYRDPEWWHASWTGVCRLFSVAVQSRSDIAARLEREVDDELVERWNQDRSFAGVRHMVGVMWAIRSFDMTSALRSLRVPVLVVFGGSGPTLECRPAVEAVLPSGGRVEVLEGAGHFVTIDQPVAFASTVGAFLSAGNG